MSAPDGWEFRLSPDRRQFAVWEPGNEPWFVPVSAMKGRFVGSGEMDRLGWTRYVPASDSGRVDGLREAAALADRTAGEYRTPRLVAEMQSLAAQLRFTADHEAGNAADRPRTEAPTASPSNRQALVHNAITDALSAAGDWVPLSVRAAATRAALAEVDAWHAGDSVRSDVGTEFMRQADQPDEAGLTAFETDPAIQRADRIVAYTPTAGRPGNGLHCRHCTPAPRSDIWTPVTAEELENGGVCTTCGADVLID